jgi:hypothetical protein
MSKFSVFLLILMAVTGCNSSSGEQQQASVPAGESSGKSMPELVVIRPDARVILDKWPQYQALEKRMGAVMEAKNPEALKLLMEELEQICSLVDDNPIPGTFEQPSVRGRIKVLRTYLGKLDAALFYRTDHGEPLAELMDSYNALRQQFNQIMSNTLTPEIFENEEIPDTE